MTNVEQQQELVRQNSSPDGIYERFDPRLVHTMALHHFHRYFCVLELCRGKRVLDIACGTGYGTALIAGVASRVVGVDIDNATIEACRAAYSGNNIFFREGGVELIPADDGEFDVVVSFETIEHVGESAQEKFFQEIQRVLKPGGLLVMSSPIRNDATKNQFHIHELTETEFHKALNAKFQNVCYFRQKIVLGSLIQQSASGAAAVFGIIAQDGCPIVPGIPKIESKYMIALASNVELPVVGTSITIDVTGKIFDAAIRTFVLRSLNPVRAQLTEQRRIATRAREAQSALSKEFADYRTGVEAELAERKRIITRLGEAQSALSKEFADYRAASEAETVENKRLIEQQRKAYSALSQEFADYRAALEAETAENQRLIKQQEEAQSALSKEFADYRTGVEAELAERKRIITRQGEAQSALSKEFADYRAASEAETAENQRLIKQQEKAYSALSKEFARYRAASEAETAENQRVIAQQEVDVQKLKQSLECERLEGQRLQYRNIQLRENVNDILSQPVWTMGFRAVKECFRWTLLSRPSAMVHLIRDILLIAPSGHFSQEYYLEKNPDIAESGVSPLFHFCNYGWKEGRNPSIRFDVRYYLNNNPDVRKSRRNPLTHYILRGRKEGRSALPLDAEETQ